MPLFPVVSSCLSLFSSLWLRGICARLTLPCLFLSRLDLCSFPSSLTTRSVGFMLVSHTDGLQRGRMDRATLCSFHTPAASKGDGWAGARFTHVWSSTLSPEPLMRAIPAPHLPSPGFGFKFCAAAWVRAPL